MKWDYVVAVLGILFLLLLRFAIPYVFRNLADDRRAARDAAQVLAARRGSPIARLDELTGSGRIYLVQMGPHDAPYSLNEFADWLRAKYSLDVRILPPVPLDSSAWDSGRKQYVAELLSGQLERDYPALAADPQAHLIAFTDADMYMVGAKWDSAFTWRHRPRTAVISAHRMQDSRWEHGVRLLQQRRIGDDQAIAVSHFHARLRRILLKDVAILYWHLPLNNDPASVLQNTLDPDVPLEDIYQSDLRPERTRWGRSAEEPCIFFAYSAKDGMRALPGTLIRSCTDVDEHAMQDESTEIFEVDLRLGLLIDKHTDFYLPGSVPIQFQRVTRDGWRGPMGFGVSGTHNYDNFLGSDDGMRTINILQADGGRYNLKRVPSWLSTLSLVKFVDADNSGKMAEMRWHTDRFEHFELKRFNGEVESYLPCCAAGSPPCLQVGFRNARGEELVFKRDERRRLTRLESPDHSWLSLSYGEGGRIAQISDSRGRTVDYGYDGGGRLVRVSYPSGQVLYYDYDSTQHLLTFSAAPNAKAQAVVLLRNEYAQGRVSRQSFGGKNYIYTYEDGNRDSIRAATVRTPEGSVFEVAVDEDGDSAVREREMTPESAAHPQP